MSAYGVHFKLTSIPPNHDIDQELQQGFDDGSRETVNCPVGLVSRKGGELASENFAVLIITRVESSRGGGHLRRYTDEGRRWARWDMIESKVRIVQCCLACEGGKSVRDPSPDTKLTWAPGHL
jgi:hypothetical protein